MAVSPELLDLLACPVCHTAVGPEPGGEGLVCESCGRVYPVEDGIPQMLPESARGGGVSGDEGS